jgi:hypothetical protein
MMVMAWRLNEAVTRGVIDNRQKGKVIGTLWLIGQESAIRLELDGNCDDDLAGCLVEFVNHKLRPDHSIGRFRDQVGAAGTITASRKVRTLPPDVRVEELNREMIEQFGWSNSLYLEWFSKFNGRVVVELVDPEVRVSEPAWSFTADEKAERQKLAEQGAGFVHMVRVDEPCGDAEKPDEFLYEQALQSFDDYVLKFEELWEKYEGDPDRDQKIADELGCMLVHDDGEEDELTSEQPNAGIEVAPTEYPEPLWWRDPLIIRAKDLCIAVSEFGKAGKLDLAASRRLDELQLSLVQGMAKLGDALHGVIEGNETRDPAFLVTLLKRSLNKYHFALGILNGLDEQIVPVATAQAWRTEILGIRQETIDAMSRLRQME